MIAMLRGRVEQILGRVVTLDVGGVGYEVICSHRCLERLQPGNETTVVVHTDVREDSIRLYGFEDQLERQVFLMLMHVQGVGAKSAADIISRIDKRELLRAIGAADEARLQTIKGIGKKTAQRMVVELKDRVTEFTLEQQAEPLGARLEVLSASEEAMQALEALGFTRKDAEKAVHMVGARGLPPDANSGQIVREALRYV